MYLVACFEESAVASVEVKTGLGAVVAGENIRVTVAVQVAPGCAIAFSGMDYSRLDRHISKENLRGGCRPTKQQR